MIYLYESMGPGRDHTRDHGSAVRHVTDCASRGLKGYCNVINASVLKEKDWSSYILITVLSVYIGSFDVLNNTIITQACR